MFYCGACQKKNDWPETLFMSRGRCEVCGKESQICFDTPSKFLPLPKNEPKMSLEELRACLAPFAQHELQVTGGKTTDGWPDRWWKAHMRRCTEGHVSSGVLISEALGRDACLAGGCRAMVTLTFPEDQDGKIPVSFKVLNLPKQNVSDT